MLDLSDPYCTLGLHETEHRGATCRKTLNPTWEEEFEFRGTEDDSRGLLADVSGWQGPARGGERLTLGELLELPNPNPSPNPSPNLSPNPNQVGGVYILLSLFMAVILDSFEDKV